MVVSTLVRGAALAALLVPSLGLAQSAPTAQLPPTGPAAPAAVSPAAVQPASPAPSAATQAAVDQRIRTLQSQRHHRSADAAVDCLRPGDAR